MPKQSFLILDGLDDMSIASHSHKCSAGQKGPSIASTLSSYGSSEKHLTIPWNLRVEY